MKFSFLTFKLDLKQPNIDCVTKNRPTRCAQCAHNLSAWLIHSAKIGHNAQCVNNLLAWLIHSVIVGTRRSTKPSVCKISAYTLGWLMHLQLLLHNDHQYPKPDIRPVTCLFYVCADSTRSVSSTRRSPNKWRNTSSATCAKRRSSPTAAAANTTRRLRHRQRSVRAAVRRRRLCRTAALRRRRCRR